MEKFTNLKVDMLFDSHLLLLMPPDWARMLVLMIPM
jgi:hypothetical protein